MKLLRVVVPPHHQIQAGSASFGAPVRVLVENAESVPVTVTVTCDGRKRRALRRA